MDGREEEAGDFISSLDAMRRVYGWRLPSITERINALMFTLLRARVHLEEESDVPKSPNMHLTNREMLFVTDLRQDKPSRNMLAWLIRENARFQALNCNHRWQTNEKTRDYCSLCGIDRYAKLNWEDPPDEPPSTQCEARR